MLVEAEWDVLTDHPMLGARLLKTIPALAHIAPIVRAHHERIDGSGYPLGLKGEEIIIEARILAVADVVEAIASHRPYRPAYGIEVALEQISKKKGILYDTAAVEACLRLFQEKRFVLE